MKNLLFLFSLIAIPLLGFSQDLRKTYAQGPITQGNVLNADNIPSYQIPDDNYTLHGSGFFASDSVIIEFKSRKRGKMSRFDMAVDSITTRLIPEREIIITTFWFFQDTKYTPFKGEIITIEDKWMFYLYAEDKIFYYIGEVL